jgi:pSer/pThr/pTyr-binding forkhead associated (FHA) protein
LQRADDDESSPSTPIHETLILGREHSCDVVLQSDTASRKHARLFLENDALYVEDLGSRNGTYKNEIRIDSKTELRDGDRLRLDKEVFYIKNAAAITNTAMNMVDSDHAMGPGGTIMASIDRDSREGGTIIAQRVNVERPSLVGVSPPYTGQVFEIAGQGVTIGRAPQNDIVLQESAVSLEHARVKYENNNWQIVDLMSANGTFVNTKKVTQMFLNPSDVIKIGPIELRFMLGGQKAKSAAAKARSASATGPVSSPQKKSTSVWVFIVIGFLIALAVGGGWLFLK